MNKTVSLIPAPTGIQPGGYIPAAFADRSAALTPSAEVTVEPLATGWRITLAWDCPEPVNTCANETDRFVDACAVLAPLVADAPWISMGTPEQPVEGLLWRPDRNEPWRIHAEGLGTVRREAPSAGTTASGNWLDGRWRVVFEIPAWQALAQNRQIAIAVWQGAAQERAGLKSISAGWLALD
ncbi:MAG: hypothetical protein IPL00_13755 [Gammaproteobacteria bacterium]|nr:hypothetical protein [Gammaproteobacteria bacterium]